MKNKKAVSLMISYVILIAIAVTMSITVFVWLRTIANIEPVKSCQEGTSIIISDYQCNIGKFNLTIKNNGRFNVNGFILTISDNVEREPIIRLTPFNTNEITKEGYFIFNDSLKPGKINEAIFGNKDQKTNKNIEFIKNIKIQSFIIDKETNEKILCEDIIKQKIEDCKISNP